MSLPTYEEVHVSMETWYLPSNTPPPDGAPTRRGIGRYLADAFYEQRLRRWPEEPEWMRLWLSRTSAYTWAQDILHIRIPFDTFKYDRLRVEWLCVNAERPTDRSQRLARLAALRWSRRRR
jgi:hypothetical protein